MSDPVRVGDLLPDFLSDLRKRCGQTGVTGVVCETMDGYSEGPGRANEPDPSRHHFALPKGA